MFFDLFYFAFWRYFILGLHVNGLNDNLDYFAQNFKNPAAFVDTWAMMGLKTI